MTATGTCRWLRMVGNVGYCCVCVHYSSHERRKNGLVNTSADAQTQHAGTDMHKATSELYDADTELRKAMLWAAGRRKEVERQVLAFEQLNASISSGDSSAEQAGRDLPSVVTALAAARASLQSADDEVATALQRAQLDDVPEKAPIDILDGHESMTAVLVHAGINPVPSSQQSSGTMAYYANEIQLGVGQPKEMSSLECCLQVVHYMRHGRAMTQYQQWYEHELSKGKLYPNLRTTMCACVSCAGAWQHRPSLPCLWMIAMTCASVNRCACTCTSCARAGVKRTC